MCSLYFLRKCQNRSSGPLTTCAHPLFRTTMIGKASTKCHMPIGFPCLPTTRTIFGRDARQIGMDLTSEQVNFQTNECKLHRHDECKLHTHNIYNLQTSHCYLKSFPKQVQWWMPGRWKCSSCWMSGQTNNSRVCNATQVGSNICEDIVATWIHKWCAAVVVCFQQATEVFGL